MSVADYAWQARAELTALNDHRDIAFKLWLDNPSAEESFDAELANAMANLQRQPKMGSTRFARRLRLRNVRTWPLSRHPYLLVYREAEHGISLLRITHMSRDLPSAYFEE